MTLLITVFAAVISTAVWYRKAPSDTMHTQVLCIMFWGASIMWLIDAIFEYAELNAAYFTPTAEEMLNDAFLGFSVIALALTVWTIIYLIKDDKGIFGKKKNK